MAAKKSTGLGKGLGALLSEPSLIVHELNAEPMIRRSIPSDWGNLNFSN